MLTITEILKRRAHSEPDAICYTFLENLESESNITYAQLHAAAERLACALLQQAQPGDRVLLLLPSGLEYIQLYWACLYAGLIAVPLYPPKANDKEGKIARIIGDCGPALAVVPDGLQPDLADQLACDTLAFLPFSGSMPFPVEIDIGYHVG